MLILSIAALCNPWVVRADDTSNDENDDDPNPYKTNENGRCANGEATCSAPWGDIYDALQDVPEVWHDERYVETSHRLERVLL